MKILSESEMGARFDFMRPLARESAATEVVGIWCIPFEYGDNAKGTRISISKAREIAAELRAAIAEAEKRELYQAFKAEEARVRAIEEQYTRASDQVTRLTGEIADLRRRHRRRGT
jgi:hypothetical protein